MLAVVLLMLVSCPGWAQAPGEESEKESSGGEGATPAPTRESTRPNVELSTFRAEVRPDFEVVLPTGAIKQHIPLRFGRFGIDTTLGYAVNGNQLDGDMVFSYRLGRFLFEQRFFQMVDFEDYVDPRFGLGGVDVFSDEEFVVRKRGLEPRISAFVTPDSRVGTALKATDTFEWSLSEEELVDEGLDLRPEVFFIYDNMKAVQPNRALELTGTAGRLSLSERFRNSFTNPVSLELQSRVLFQALIGDEWGIEEHLSFDTLIDVWRDDLARMYQLGGFDSVRGYAPNEIKAVRAGMLSSEVSRRVLRSWDRSFTVRERRRVQVHQHRVFVLNDVAVTQKELNLESKASFHGSAGLGIGTVVSIGRVHLDVSVAAAQPFDIERLPVAYVRTTLFNFERNL